MVSIGTPFSSSACKVLLCGSGELGKEVAIELQRLGVEVIACDRYENAPAMQVADRSYCFSMLDGDELRRVIELEKPDYVVPEIEAIATSELLKLEAEGFTVVLPHLFGPLGKISVGGNLLRVMCMRREFRLFAKGKTSPVVDWLRALCKKLNHQLQPNHKPLSAKRTPASVRGSQSLGTCSEDTASHRRRITG